jgi:enolase
VYFLMVLSLRVYSGETEDTFIADLAVGLSTVMLIFQYLVALKFRD